MADIIRHHPAAKIDQGNKRFVEVRAGEYAEEVVIPGDRPMRTRGGLAYYASGDGGRVAFQATTEYVTITGTTEQALAAFRNPAGSGKDVVLFYGEFGSTQNTEFRRFRGSTITINATPPNTPRPVVNMGGGTATPVGELYVPGTFTASGGTSGKTAFIQAYAQYVADRDLDGATRLRPGQGIYWTITGGQQQAHRASIFLCWAEITAMA